MHFVNRNSIFLTLLNLKIFFGIFVGGFDSGYFAFEEAIVNVDLIVAVIPRGTLTSVSVDEVAFAGFVDFLMRSSKSSADISSIIPLPAPLETFG